MKVWDETFNAIINQDKIPIKQFKKVTEYAADQLKLFIDGIDMTFRVESPMNFREKYQKLLLSMTNKNKGNSQDSGREAALKEIEKTKQIING